MWSRQAAANAGLPVLQIKKVWVEHNTHLTVAPWWERGTMWEGKPAMTVYTQLFTQNLQGMKVNLQVVFENANGSLVRWQQGAPPHCRGKDGVLRPWWGDKPSASPFEYRAFRIAVPYSAIDQSTVQGADGKVIVKVKAWRGATYSRGETHIDVSRILSD